MAQKMISTAELAKLKKGDRLTDTAVQGFFARRLPSGKVSFGYQYVDKVSHARRFITIGLLGEVTVEQARDQAKVYSGQRAQRRDPAAELTVAAKRSENTVDFVLDQHLAKYATKLRGREAREKAFARYVRPAIGRKAIYDVERDDITKMLDKIAKTGPRMADVVLAFVRKAFNWWAVQDGNFKSPIVIGMARTSITEYARDRVLSGEELIDIWRALDELDLGTDAPHCFPGFVRTLLLTGCRRSEVGDMHTREFEAEVDPWAANTSGASTAKAVSWTIPATRYKTKRPHLLPLGPAIKKLLPERATGFVFSSDDGETPFSGYSKAKDALDRMIAAIRKREGRPPMPRWTFHDLRRTASTIMASAGVAHFISERVLGHVIPGIGAVYNRFEYRDEKADALTRLAFRVDQALNPQPDKKGKVTSIASRRAREKPAAARGL